MRCSLVSQSFWGVRLVIYAHVTTTAVEIGKIFITLKSPFMPRESRLTSSPASVPFHHWLTFVPVISPFPECLLTGSYSVFPFVPADFFQLAECFWDWQCSCVFRGVLSWSCWVMFCRVYFFIRSLADGHGLFLVWVDDEWSYLLSCVGLCVDVCFHFSCVNGTAGSHSIWETDLVWHAAICGLGLESRPCKSKSSAVH